MDGAEHLSRSGPSTSESDRMHVVVAGGGIAGAEALLALRDLAGNRIDLTLISPSPDLVYRPLAVAEPFGLGHVRRFPLADLLQAVDAQRIDGALEKVDEPGRAAILSDGRRVAFDALVVAVGAQAAPGIPSATTWYPEGDPDLYGGLLRDVEEGYVRRLVFAVPLGAVWPLPVYELALMTARDAAAMGMQPEITIVTPEAVPLALFGGTATQALTAELEAAGVRLETASVARLEAGKPQRVVLQPSVRRLDADRVITVPEVVGPRVEGLPHNEHGFIPTEADGRVKGSERVWAAGDGIAYPIKYGGLATQQADIAATGIARLAGATVEDVPRLLRLEGTLMTGARPRPLSDEPEPKKTPSPLWMPERKVYGRYLSPYLEGRDGGGAGKATAPAAGVAVDETLPGLDTDATGDFSPLWRAEQDRADFFRRLGEDMHE